MLQGAAAGAHGLEPVEAGQSGSSAARARNTCAALSRARATGPHFSPYISLIYPRGTAPHGLLPCQQAREQTGYGAHSSCRTLTLPSWLGQTISDEAKTSVHISMEEGEATAHKGKHTLEPPVTTQMPPAAVEPESVHARGLRSHSDIPHCHGVWPGRKRDSFGAALGQLLSGRRSIQVWESWIQQDFRSHIFGRLSSQSISGIWPIYVRYMNSRRLAWEV